ncbi:hypothetical protein FZEAL_6587, partial [Fusarium zealandicum]
MTSPSTRASSPAASGGSPELLTPRSKIRALCATIDSSDDDGSPSTRIAKKKSPRTTQVASLPRLSSQTEDASDDESEEEIRPRGRLAARMLGITRPPQPAETADNNETARDRVGKMIERQEKEAQKTQNVDMPDVQSEEDDLPVAPRRLVRKTPRSQVADATAQGSRGSSPGLF